MCIRDSAYLQQEAIKRISKQVTGGALLTLAYAIRTSEVGGEHWDEIMDGNGRWGIKKISTNAMYRTWSSSNYRYIIWVSKTWYSTIN